MLSVLHVYAHCCVVEGHVRSLTGMLAEMMCFCLCVMVYLGKGMQ